jgi:hypothetical protein
MGFSAMFCALVVMIAAGLAEAAPPGDCAKTKDLDVTIQSCMQKLAAAGASVFDMHFSEVA